MIGKKLKELIKQQNIKQIKLAKYVGISPSRLSNYLSDKREPDLDMLAKMAKYLNVDLNYFTDVKFTPSKDVEYPRNEEPEYSYAAENTEEYKAFKSVYLPFLSINSKKRAPRTTKIPVWQTLTDGSDTEDMLVFEVTTSIGDEYFKQGDYIVAKKFEKSEKSGALVFETGRNGKIYNYVNDKDAQFLLADTSKEVIPISDKDLSGFYTVMWVVKRIS